MSGQRRPKRKKDPNAPKNCRSSYMFFVQQQRPIVIAENPHLSVPESGRELGRRWKLLSEHARRPYVRAAKADKKRYMREKASYEAPPPPQRLTKTGKKRKDPNAPKACRSSYMYFSQALRPVVMAENPNFGVPDCGRELGRRWQALSQRERAPFEKLARADKARYDWEKQAYIPPEEEIYEEPIPQRPAKRKKDPNAPKGAMSAYMFFAQQQHAVVMAEYPHYSLPDTGRELGRRWKSLSKRARRPYDQLASADKMRYQQEKMVYDGTI